MLVLTNLHISTVVDFVLGICSWFKIHPHWGAMCCSCL